MGEESVGRVAIYSLLPTDLPTVCIPSVNPSAKPSVILTGNRHVTARTCYSNPSVIPSVPSRIRALVFNSVGDSIGKITRQNLRATARLFFIDSEFSVGNSVEANFPPSLWGCSFASFSFPQTEFESYSRKVEELKENVKDMLMASKKDTVEHIEFINQLCRLGVSYHFDDEIENSLKEIFYDLPNLLEKHDFDLYTVSLLFRALRQHGFKIPCGERILPLYSLPNFN
ncbi:hypothetical protein NC651_039468 [Populus alba x Populus x berolinensis]|nr:hypothetical protein NC651_039468 [Populus alba x Populus x berolinensis]